MGRVAAVLVNGNAGGRRGGRRAEAASRELRAAGFEVHTLAGRSIEEAEALARAAVAGRPDVLVAAGGDGTVHCAVQAVAGTSVPLGIIPAGTGNDTAAVLGLPDDPVAAAAVVARGRTRTIDAGRAEGGRWWVGVLSAGFDSAVAERANRMRWPLGPRRYDLAVLLELIRLRPHRMRLELDGEPIEEDITLVAVGNGPQYGGGYRICPDAQLDDGLLDVTTAARLTRVELMRIKPSVRTGGHVRHPAVRVWRARVIRLDAPGLVAYGDGERVGPLPLRVECVPGALRVLVP